MNAETIANRIHVRIRTFDSSGNATYDFLTQTFFDDTLTDTVKVAALGSGTRTVRLPVGRTVRSGRATLQIIARDTSGNRKVLSRILEVPSRSASLRVVNVG